MLAEYGICMKSCLGIGGGTFLWSRVNNGSTIFRSLLLHKLCSLHLDEKICRQAVTYDSFITTFATVTSSSPPHQPLARFCRH